MENNKKEQFCVVKRHPTLNTPYSKFQASDDNCQKVDAEGYKPIGSEFLISSVKKEECSSGPSIWTESTKPNARRKRTCYTDEQTEYLRQVFSQTRYPSRMVYLELSNLFSIPVSALKIWFKNRRARCKRGAIQQTSTVDFQDKNERRVAAPYRITQTRMNNPCIPTSCNRCCCFPQQAVYPWPALYTI